MYVKRLRSKHSDEALRRIYRKPHDHRRWWDHFVRVEQTYSLGKFANIQNHPGPVTDLSCGNGSIAKALAAHHGKRALLGDFAPGFEIQGPIEETIKTLQENASLFILSETIEHLDQPALVLGQVRERADSLILSTPISEGKHHASDNLEHYWGWDVEAIASMLADSRWHPRLQVDLNIPGHTYDYQIWLCD